MMGCANAPRPGGTRPFQFEADTFTYANDVDMEYACDPQGRWRGHARQPPSDYTPGQTHLNLLWLNPQ